MVTGRGSVKADNFAASLGTYTASPITFDSTEAHGTHPLNMKRVKKGKIVDFTGG